jgi:hypothetical protein
MEKFRKNALSKRRQYSSPKNKKNDIIEHGEIFTRIAISSKSPIYNIYHLDASMLTQGYVSFKLVMQIVR